LNIQPILAFGIDNEIHSYEMLAREILRDLQSAKPRKVFN